MLGFLPGPMRHPLVLSQPARPRPRLLLDALPCVRPTAHLHLRPERHPPSLRRSQNVTPKKIAADAVHAVSRAVIRLLRIHAIPKPGDSAA